jgi:hypothetical protein
VWSGHSCPLLLTFLLPVSLRMLVDYARNPLPLAPETNPPLILLPMLATFACLRLFLHLVHVQHIYPGGYLVQFLGVLITVPAAFTLAFGTRTRMVALAAPAALGIAALMLDEVAYLVATNASGQDYVSSISLEGARVLIFLAVVLLLALYKSRRSRR